MLANHTMCDKRSLEKRSASRQTSTSASATASRGRASLLRATARNVAIRLAAFVVASGATIAAAEPDAHSLSIVCCDFPPDISVRGEYDAGSLAASVITIVTKSPIILLPRGPSLTPVEIKKAPQTIFLDKLQPSLASRGFLKSNLIYPSDYNAFEGRYDVTDGITDSALVLEVRFLAEIVSIYDAYMPSAGAYFRLSRSIDKKTLTSGVVATVNTTRGEPNFFTRPYLVPLIPKLGSHGLGKEMTLLPAPASQIFATFDPRSTSDVARMEMALTEIAERVAVEVAGHAATQLPLVKK